VYILAAPLLNIRIWASIPGGPSIIFTWGITLILIGVLTITALISIRTIILCTILHRTGVIITGIEARVSAQARDAG
jgi:hypothetical protein